MEALQALMVMQAQLDRQEGETANRWAPQWVVVGSRDEYRYSNAVSTSNPACPRLRVTEQRLRVSDHKLKPFTSELQTLSNVELSLCIERGRDADLFLA